MEKNQSAAEKLKQKSEQTLEAQPKKENLRDLVKAMGPEIEKALPGIMTPDRFVRLALTALKKNPGLNNCSRNSVLGGLMLAAQLGLEPNGPLGHAYLIPYSGEAQFQLGYKGLITLARRTGQFKRIEAREVYENDTFEVAYGLEQKLIHIPLLEGNRGEIKGYYALYTLENGGEGFEFANIEDMKAFGKKYSKSYNKGPWQDNFDEMAKKTLIKKVLKYAPISTEVQQVLANDSVKAEYDMTKEIKEGEEFLEIDYSIEEE